MTAHGGTIVAGFPTVLIGGMPAARLTDMHVCPMQTPAVVPIPHVGGPIFMIGSPTVLIGGLPAARIGDMAICVGPPDVIVMGCFTVLIGEAGGGAGGAGGGAGGGGTSRSAGADAIISAGMAMTAGGPGMTSEGGQAPASETAGPEGEPGHYIEFHFVDKVGNPICGVPFEFTAPDGTEREGRLSDTGVVRWAGQDTGQGKVKLMYVSNARWSADKARVGETVKMTADVYGYPSGTEAKFEIYERDASGADDLITAISAQTQGEKVEAQWDYRYTEDADDVQTQSEVSHKYSSPEYYFVVKAGRSQARSGILDLRDYVEIELEDMDAKLLGGEEYFLYLPNGEIRKGKLDQNGYAKEDNIPPGKCRVRFPNLSDVASKVE